MIFTRRWGKKVPKPIIQKRALECQQMTVFLNNGETIIHLLCDKIIRVGEKTDYPYDFVYTIKERRHHDLNSRCMTINEDKKTIIIPDTSILKIELGPIEILKEVEIIVDYE